MKLKRFLTAPLLLYCRVESVSDAHPKQHAVTEFLAARKESVGNIHKDLCGIYGSDVVNTSTSGCWAEK
jgi:hypothetical protein